MSMSSQKTKENKFECETAEATEEHYSILVPEEQQDDEDVWGRLMPLSNSFKRCNLVADEVSFGKDPSCDYVILDQNDNLPADRFATVYSKRHFRIAKESGLIYIYDDSANGTFLHGTKIGKGKRAIVASGEKIALGVPNNPVFLYMENNSGNSGVHLPEAFSKKYMLGSVLGHGACGEVRLCFAKCTDKKYAVKIVDRRNYDSRERAETEFNMREVDILRQMDHPNIVRIFEVFESEEQIFILLEYVESGDLFDWITKVLALWKGADRCARAKPIFAQMVLAVKYLHDRGVTHRDLKPENLLLSGSAQNYIVKITDFGLSKVMTDQTMLRTFCGTPTYLAPEILHSMGVGGYTKAVDCWSLGVILFLLLAGYPPFSTDYKEMTLDQQIKTGRYRFFESEWKGVDPEARALVKELLKVNPGDRLTIDGVLLHPWLQDDDMKGKLCFLIPNLEWPVIVHSGPSNGKRKFNQISDGDDSAAQTNQSPKRSRKSV